MRILLDAPQPLDQLRKLYNDKVAFVTSTTSYPLISEIEVPGDYLSAMRKRLVPVRVGKKLDRFISRYTTKLQHIWDRQHQELIESLRPSQLGKSEGQDDLEKQQEPTLAQVLAETDPSRQQVLLIRYLRARKQRLIKPKLDALKAGLKRAARTMFEDAYRLGKERGQILTNQELDDDLSEEDERQLSEKEDWNEAFLALLVADTYKDYEQALEADYETEEELLEALGKAQEKERHRLPMFAAALGSLLLATGMTQAIKDVQEVDEETGLPTGEPKRDPETGLPLGEAYEGGIWHTRHDERVCEGCEDNDGNWMTLDEFNEEIGTNQCLSNCRCAELFEPAQRPDDPSLIWDGIPGIDKGAGLTKHLPGQHDQAEHDPHKGGERTKQPSLRSESDKELWRLSQEEWQTYKSKLRTPDGKLDLEAVTSAIKERERGVEDAALSAIRSQSGISFPELEQRVGVEVPRLSGALRRLAGQGKLRIHESEFGPVGLSPSRYWTTQQEQKTGVAKHLAGQHDQTTHGAWAQGQAAGEPTAEIEREIGTVTVAEPELRISAERDSSEFVEAVRREIAEARQHLKVKPAVSKEDLGNDLTAQAHKAYDHALEGVKLNLQADEIELAKMQTKLEEQQRLIAEGQAAPDSANWMSNHLSYISGRIDRLKQKAEYLERPVSRAAFMRAVSSVVDGMAKETTLGTQQMKLAGFREYAWKLLGKELKKDRDSVRTVVADALYTVLSGKETEFKQQVGQELDGYFENHFRDIVVQYERATDEAVRNARQAVEGGTISRVVKGSETYQQGKAWIHANVSPELLAQVTPVNWEAKRGGGRSYYRPEAGTIQLATRRESPHTVPHEFSHHIERDRPEIAAFFQRYYAMRTEGETPRKLSRVVERSGFRAFEYTRVDHWAHPYMGHTNLTGGGERRPGGEIFSTAVGMLADRRSAAELFVKDPELFGVVMTVLKGRVPKRIDS